jgi:hypothetical protein
MAKRKPPDDTILTSDPPEDTPPPPPETPLPPAADDQTPPEEEAFVSIRDAAKEMGVDLSSYEDDDTALRALVTQVQQAEQWRQLAEQQRLHLAQLQTTQQPSKQEPEPPKEPTFWNPPEFNPSWLSLVTRGPNGELIPNTSAGGTPDIVAKIQQYATHRMQEQDRFWQDPYKYFDQYLQHREGKLLDRARDLAREEDSRLREGYDTRSFIDKNSTWLFDHDEQQQPTMRNGRPVLSDEGQAFMGFVNEASQDLKLPPDAQIRYAQRLLEGWRASRGSGTSPEQKKQDFLSQHNPPVRQPNPAASTHRAPDRSGQTPPQNPQQSLEELMRSNLKAAGITDQDLAVY